MSLVATITAFVLYVWAVQ